MTGFQVYIYIYLWKITKFQRVMIYNFRYFLIIATPFSQNVFVAAKVMPYERIFFK